MGQSSLDVIGVGNAIVDVISDSDDAFLAAHGVPKGGMILVNEPRAEEIYAAMGETRVISGGSAANSMACLASLGGRAGFVGKVANDRLGAAFRREIEEIGVEFTTAPLIDGPGTGRCLINVTPDAQRSMTTFLGAAGFVAPEDIDVEMVRRAEITFFEGYLFEQPVARQAFIKACLTAKAAGRKAAITLSDSSCVDRQHEAFTDFIGAHVDILLANEREAETLFETADLNEMIVRARALAPLTAITRSERGSLLIPREGAPVEIAAIAPDRLVDTTGAGDAYAAGLLFGLARGFDLKRAGRFGSLAAAEAISHYGARPQRNLAAFAAEMGVV
jgi:sugar/nucleoside kinase (ribokinase family)